MPARALASSRWSTSAPGGMVRAIDPACRATTSPSRAPASSWSAHCQSAVPSTRKSYSTTPSRPTATMASEVGSAARTANDRSTPLPSRWARSRWPSRSSAIRASRRAGPTATFAGLPPGAARKTPSPPAGTKSTSASPATATTAVPPPARSPMPAPLSPEATFFPTGPRPASSAAPPAGMQPGALARWSGLQGFDELLFPLLGQVGLDDCRVEGLDGVDHPVNGGRAGEQEHRRPAFLEPAADLLDGVVVDADVSQLAAQRPTCGPDGQPGHRHQEQHADQGPLQGAGGRPGPGQADRLLDTDLALVVPVGVGGVLELQQLLLGQVTGKVEESLGVVAVVDTEYHQVRHAGPPRL